MRETPSMIRQRVRVQSSRAGRIRCFGAITYNGQDNSTIYNALQAKGEKRFSAGLWYLIAYTWSKSISVGNTPTVGGDYAYERALTSFDIPHNFTGSAGSELP